MDDSVCAFLSGIIGNGATPTMITHQYLGMKYASTMASRIDEYFGIKAFSCLNLRLIRTGNKHGILNNFLKMKPSTFAGSYTKDAFEFIIDYYVRIHEIGIVE